MLNQPRTNTKPYATPRKLDRAEAFDMAARWLEDSFHVDRDDIEAMAEFVCELDDRDHSAAELRNDLLVAGYRLDDERKKVFDLETQHAIDLGVIEALRQQLEAANAQLRLNTTIDNACRTIAGATAAEVTASLNEQIRNPHYPGFDTTDLDDTTIVVDDPQWK